MVSWDADFIKNRYATLQLRHPSANSLGERLSLYLINILISCIPSDDIRLFCTTFIAITRTIIIIMQILTCSKGKKGGNQSARVWRALLAFRVSLALGSGTQTRLKLHERRKRKKLTPTRASPILESRPSGTSPLKRTCRRCQQQITGRSILLTQRASTGSRESGSSANAPEQSKETQPRDSATHESLAEPDGRSER